MGKLIKNGIEYGGGGGSGESYIELDTTLSIAGKAADAKAVGDALSNPKNLLTNIYFSSANIIKIEYRTTAHSFDIIRGRIGANSMGLNYIILIKEGAGTVMAQTWSGAGGFNITNIEWSYNTANQICTVTVTLDNNLQGSYGISSLSLENSYVHSAFL